MLGQLSELSMLSSVRRGRALRRIVAFSLFLGIFCGTIPGSVRSTRQADNAVNTTKLWTGKGFSLPRYRFDQEGLR